MKPRFKANVSLWLNCNLKCPYCFANPIAPPDEWSEEVEQKLAQFEAFVNETGYWEFDFSGGEVTIYPGFVDLCERLASSGHTVNFYTNGVIPLQDMFSPSQLTSVNRVVFSNHIAQDKSKRLSKIFDDNVRYLKHNGVDVAVNYVLYPNRPYRPDQIRERYQAMGADVQFRAFQGEYDGEQYPYAYRQEQKNEFRQVGDIKALYMMSHGYYVPTFKACNSGHSDFYLSYRTGGVYVCEQIQHRELANFYQSDAVEQFRSNVLPEPIRCPARKCSCRLTVDQEQFLEQHDIWDMDNYPAWEAVSAPTPEASAHWHQHEDRFARELEQRLQGDQIYIWGAGIHTLMLLKLLQENSFDMSRLKGIVDSNRLKLGHQLAGIRVSQPNVLHLEAAEQCSDIIISSRAFEQEIYQTIKAQHGDKFNVVCLYDGSMQCQNEKLLETV